MPKSIDSQTSFAGGEWSNTVSSRVDQQKYKAACIQLRNMMCLKTGPALRRPGTQFIAPAKIISGGNYCVRMYDFQFSINTKFALEWGHNYVRFYSNGFLVQVGSAATWISGQNYPAGSYAESAINSEIYYTSAGDPNSSTDPANNGLWVQQTILEVPTPYSALAGSAPVNQTEVYQLKFAAINDVIYVNHPNHPRGKLTRFSDTNWQYQVVLDLTPALLDENATDTTIAASSAAGTTVLTASAPTWQTAFNYSVGDSVLETFSIIAGNPGTANNAMIAGNTYVITTVGNVTNWPAMATNGGVIPAAQMVKGQGYIIQTPGTTTWTGLGSPNNNSGQVFVYNGVAPTGTGTCYLQEFVYNGVPSTYSGATPGVVTSLYECEFPHTSGTFVSDYTAGYWSQQTIFQFAHVGAFWELSYLRASDYIEYDAASANANLVNGTSATITAFGTWEVHTYGVWSADIEIQSSTNGGQTWQSVATFTGRYDRNTDVSGSASAATLYRIVVTNATSTPPSSFGPTVPRVVFECVDAFLFGTVQITGVANSYQATAQVITPLTVANDWVSGSNYSVGDRVGYNGVNYVCISSVSGSTIPPSDATHWSADGWPTIYWSEGAWSAVRGYPAAITVYQQRVWCGYTSYQPQRIWGTQQNDIENWDLGDQTLATDGLAFDLDAVGDGAILWMQSQTTMFIGMVEAEWIITPGDGTQSITATNISANRQSRWGSNVNIQAIVVGDGLIFSQRQGFSLRQMLFALETNKYMSQDLTALSDQILNGGALQMAYQKQASKNGILWVTTANGEMVGMTYELDQQVFGWHRHFTGLGIDAGFESVCTIEGSGTADDEVWVSVNRTINGSAVRYIERINPINWQTVIPQPGQTPGYGPNKNLAFYVDSGVTITSPSSNVFNNLVWLNARTVSVCINGQDYGTYLVSGVFQGITVPSYAPAAGNNDIVSIGLPFTSTVQPMNLDVDPRAGVTQGLIKKVSGLTLNLLNTLACKVTDGSFKSTVNAGAFNIGQTYTIVSLGTTDFTAAGAQSNTLGLTFTATGAGSGTGKAGQNPRIFELVFRDTSNPMNEPQLYSDFYEVKQFSGDYGYDIPVIIFTDGPLPLCVLGDTVSYGITGTP